MELLWSLEATIDLDEIYEYISRNSEQSARKVVRSVVDAANALTSNPQLGRVYPAMADPLIRERIVGAYRLIYRLRGQQIEIAHVLHGARQSSTRPR